MPLDTEKFEPDSGLLAEIDKLTGFKPKNRIAPSSNALTQSELEDALRKAGWDEKYVPTMSAIGMAESVLTPDGRAKIDSYNPGIGAGGKPTAERSYGNWQINMLPSLNRPYDKNKLNSDPVYNAKAALDIFQKQGFRAWGAYTDGRYKKFLKGRSLSPSSSSSPNDFNVDQNLLDNVDAALNPQTFKPDNNLLSEVDNALGTSKVSPIPQADPNAQLDASARYAQNTPNPIVFDDLKNQTPTFRRDKYGNQVPAMGGQIPVNRQNAIPEAKTTPEPLSNPKFTPNSRLAPREQSDLDLLSQKNQVWPNNFDQDFSKSLSPEDFSNQVELSKNYQEYLQLSGQSHSEKALREFNKILQDSQNNANLVNRQDLRPSQNAAQKENQARNSKPGVRNPNNKLSYPVPKTRTGFLSDENYGQSLAAEIQVDISKKPKGMGLDEYLFRAGLKGVAGQYGLTNADIDRALTTYRRNGNLILNRPDLANINDKELNDYIKKRGRTLTFQVTRENVAAALGSNEKPFADFKEEQQNNALKIASQQNPLEFRAKDQDALDRSFRTGDYQKILAQNRQLAADGINPEIYRDAEKEVYTDPTQSQTEDAVKKRYQQLLDSAPDKEQVETIQNIAENLKNLPGDRETYGIQSSGLGGILGALGGISNLLAGFARYVGEDEAYTYFRRLGNYAVISENALQSDNLLAKASNFTGRAFVDVPKYIALSVMPGGAVVGMGLDAGLQSYGTGSQPLGALGNTAKGAIMGAIFHSAPKFQASLEEGFTRALVNPVFDAGKTAGSDILLASKVFGTIGRFGYVTVGGGTVERLSGKSTFEALKAGAITALSDLVFEGRNFGEIKDLAGKVFRLRNSKTGAGADVTVEPSGEVLQLKGEVPDNAVDLEFDLANVKDVTLDKDGVYRVKNDSTVSEATRPVTPQRRGNTLETSPEPKLIGTGEGISPEKQAEIINNLDESDALPTFKALINEGMSPYEAGKAVEAELEARKSKAAEKSALSNQEVENNNQSVFAAEDQQTMPQTNGSGVSEAKNSGTKTKEREKTTADDLNEFDAGSRSRGGDLAKKEAFDEKSGPDEEEWRSDDEKTNSNTAESNKTDASGDRPPVNQTGYPNYNVNEEKSKQKQPKGQAEQRAAQTEKNQTTGRQPANTEAQSTVQTRSGFADTVNNSYSLLDERAKNLGYNNVRQLNVQNAISAPDSLLPEERKLLDDYAALMNNGAVERDVTTIAGYNPELFARWFRVNLPSVNGNSLDAPLIANENNLAAAELLYKVLLKRNEPGENNSAESVRRSIKGSRQPVDISFEDFRKRYDSNDEVTTREEYERIIEERKAYNDEVDKTLTRLKTEGPREIDPAAFKGTQQGMAGKRRDGALFAGASSETEAELTRLTKLSEEDLGKLILTADYRPGQNRIVVSAPVIEYLRRLEGYSGLIEGLHYHAGVIKSVVNDIYDSSDETTGQLSRFFEKFAGDISQIAARDGNIIIALPERLAHELHHAASELGASRNSVKLGRKSLKNRVDQSEAVRRPEYRVAEPFLLSLGYGEGGHAELIEELMSYVAEGRYEQVGLSEKQGIKWAKWWYNSYLKQGYNLHHPLFDEAVSQNSEIGKVLENVRKKSQTDETGNAAVSERPAADARRESDARRETDEESEGTRSEPGRGNAADYGGLSRVSAGRRKAGRISGQAEREASDERERGNESGLKFSSGDAVTLKNGAFAEFSKYTGDDHAEVFSGGELFRVPADSLTSKEASPFDKTAGDTGTGNKSYPLRPLKEIENELSALARQTKEESYRNAAYSEKYAPGMNRIVVNAAQIDVVRRLAGFDEDSLIEGIHYSLDDAEYVGTRLIELSENYQGRVAEFFGKFGADIQRIARRDGNIVISTPERLVHELHHAASELGAGGKSLKHRVDQSEGWKKPEFKIAEPYLLNLKYGWGGHAELIEEMMSFCVEGRFQEIGLNAKQSSKWIRWWYNSYAKKGHNLAHSLFDEAVAGNEKVRRILENVRKRHPVVFKGQAEENSRGETDGESEGDRREPGRGNAANYGRLSRVSAGRRKAGRISDEAVRKESSEGDIGRRSPAENRSSILEAGSGAASSSLSIGKDAEMLSLTEIDALYDFAASKPHKITKHGLKITTAQAELLRRVETYFDLRAGRTKERKFFTGQHLSLPIVKDIRAVLVKTAATLPKATGVWLRNFAADLQAAARRTGSVIIYTDDRYILHEQGHQGSFLASAGTPLDGRIEVEQGVRQPAYRIARPKLLEIGYDDDPSHLIEEIYTRIVAGELATIGLDEKLAEDFLDWWYNSFAAKGHDLFHPALEKSAFGKEILKNVRESVTRSDDRRGFTETGGKSGGGDSSGDQGVYRLADRREGGHQGISEDAGGGSGTASAGASEKIRSDVSRGIKNAISDRTGRETSDGGESGRLFDESGIKDDKIQFTKTDGEDAFYPKDFYEHEASWFRAVDRFIKEGGWDKPRRVLGHTPGVLQKLGLTDRQITITPTIMAKVMRDHDLSESIVKRLAREIASPVMVFESIKRDGSKVIVTSLKDSRNEPVTVVVMPDGTIERLLVNPIKSAYGRPVRDFRNWIEQGLLRYVNIEKYQKSFQFAGLQLPMKETTSGKNRILNEHDIVNDLPLSIIGEKGAKLTDAEKTGWLHQFRRQSNLIGNEIKRFGRLPLIRLLTRDFEISYNRQEGTLDFNATGGAILGKIIERSHEQRAAFGGAYANRTQSDLILRTAVEMRDEFRAGNKQGVAKVLDKIIDQITTAQADAAERDLVMVVKDDRAPLFRRYAKQEEFGHKAISDSGIREKLVDLNVEIDKKFEQPIEREYNDFSETGKRDELWAKHFRDDAPEYFNATEKEN